MSHRDWDLSCKVYIGNLGNNASKHEIETSFTKYGPLKNIWIARNPPGFAFAEFEDPRDAEDAVRGLDGTKMDGSRIRVEMSSGRTRQRNSSYRGGGDRYGGGGSGGGRGSYNGGGGRSYNRSRSPSPRRRRSRSRSRSGLRGRSGSRDSR